MKGEPARPLDKELEIGAADGWRYRLTLLKKPD
jgi:hypothetical protein